MRELNRGVCEHCQESFSYYLVHSGFNDSSYAYCDSCGSTSLLSYWSKLLPRWPEGKPHYEEIPVELEQALEPCSCSGRFQKGASPRCPHCRQKLSAKAVTAFVESNAPGTAKGWRWQGNWHSTYCIVIENHAVSDNFKASQEP